jgi:hypothetical protein
MQEKVPMALTESIKQQRKIGRLILERDQINVQLALLRLQLEKAALAERSLYIMQASTSAQNGTVSRVAS